jgi:hypothetical protein
MLTFFEAVAVVAALLMLPCVLTSLAFGGELTEPLAEVVLVATAGTAMLTGIAIHEGWYADHLSRLAGSDEALSGPPRNTDLGTGSPPWHDASQALVPRCVPFTLGEKREILPSLGRAA